MNWCEYPPEFYTETRVRARKPHRCCETKRVINPGEMYWRIVGKWDGSLDCFSQSEAAYHFARWLNHVGEPGNHHDECIAFGGVAEHVRDSQDPELIAEWERVKRGEITRNA